MKIFTVLLCTQIIFTSRKPNITYFFPFLCLKLLTKWFSTTLSALHNTSSSCFSHFLTQSTNITSRVEGVMRYLQFMKHLHFLLCWVCSLLGLLQGYYFGCRVSDLVLNSLFFFFGILFFLSNDDISICVSDFQGDVYTHCFLFDFVYHFPFTHAISILINVYYFPMATSTHTVSIMVSTPNILEYFFRTSFTI